MTSNSKFKTPSIRLILIVFLCVSALAAYARPGLFTPEKLAVELIKPGMTKYDVKKILREPYKISFYTNDKQELVEELYYKTVHIYYESFYITYRIVIVNDKVTALLQEEDNYITKKIEVIKKE